MKTPNSSPILNKQIYEEAAEWLVELRVGDVGAQARQRLDTWFRESPHHVRAFLELSSIWEDGGDPDLDRPHSTDALISRIRTMSNVVPLGGEASSWTPERDDAIAASTPHAQSTTFGSRIPGRAVLAASLVCAGLIGTLGSWLYSQMQPHYATGIGEERTIRLTDGSTVELNSNSRIRVHFSEQERDVDLVQGQALFQVAKDASRPFVVHSDSARVRAVGTQFDVYKKTSGTTVTVVEGRVAVVPTAAAEAVSHAIDWGKDTIIVMAGEQVTIAPSKTPTPKKADVTAATAWTQHELIFDSTPLEAVAQEFNRYNVRQLIVDDTGLEDFHVTGVFSSTDPASLLRFLQTQRGIHVDDSDREIRISKK